MTKSSGWLSVKSRCKTNEKNNHFLIVLERHGICFLHLRKKECATPVRKKYLLFFLWTLHTGKFACSFPRLSPLSMTWTWFSTYHVPFSGTSRTGSQNCCLNVHWFRPPLDLAFEVCNFLFKSTLHQLNYLLKALSMLSIWFQPLQGTIQAKKQRNQPPTLDLFEEKKQALTGPTSGGPTHRYRKRIKKEVKWGGWFAAMAARKLRVEIRQWRRFGIKFSLSQFRSGRSCSHWSCENPDVIQCDKIPLTTRSFLLDILCK